MARVRSEVVVIIMLPVVIAGRRNGVSAASPRAADSGEAGRGRQSIDDEEPTSACSTCCQVSYSIDLLVGQP